MLRSSKPVEILETFGFKDEDEHAADNELNVFFRVFSEMYTPKGALCSFSPEAIARLFLLKEVISPLPNAK